MWSTGAKARTPQDDINITHMHDPSWEGHLTAVDATLKCVIAAGLKLALTKCEWGSERMAFLGHVITPNGIEPDPEKIAAVQRWQPPTSMKELQCMLGAWGYYRRFVRNWSKRAYALTSLMRKGQPWRWGEDQQAAFLDLQTSLCSHPILRRPRWDAPFIVQVDFSQQGFGACLAQRDPDNPRLDYAVAYASRRVTKWEANMSAVEGELGCIVWAVCHKFRPYLFGCPYVEVWTDHAGLQYLSTAKNLTGRLARWMLQLAQFNLKVVYRKSASHRNVDCLSRVFPHKTTASPRRATQEKMCLRMVTTPPVHWNTANQGPSAFAAPSLPPKPAGNMASAPRPMLPPLAPATSGATSFVLPLPLCYLCRRCRRLRRPCWPPTRHPPPALFLLPMDPPRRWAT